VEHALRTRFRLQIRNVMDPDRSDSIFSQPQGDKCRNVRLQTKGERSGVPLLESFTGLPFGAWYSLDGSIPRRS